jgi:hypothetical protein
MFEFRMDMNRTDHFLMWLAICLAAAVGIVSLTQL